MKRIHVIALALVLGLATAPLAAARTSAPRPDRSPAFKRALNNALTRSQRRFATSKDVWQDHSTWDRAWVVTSQHYTVRMTGSRFLARKLAGDLDTMLGNFQTVLGTDYAPSTRFNVDVYPGLTEYNAFGNANGADHSSFYGVFYTNQVAERPVATYQLANYTRLGMWATHGALHQYIDHAFPTALPTWVAEGLASFFEFYWDYYWFLDRFEEMRANQRVIPLSRLLNDNIASYANQTEDRFIELGLFFSYLIQHRGDTKTVESEDGSRYAPFIDYLRALARGNARSIPLHELFTVDLDQLERDFLAFEFPR